MKSSETSGHPASTGSASGACIEIGFVDGERTDGILQLRIGDRPSSGREIVFEKAGRDLVLGAERSAGEDSFAVDRQPPYSAYRQTCRSRPFERMPAAGPRVPACDSEHCEVVSGALELSA